MILRELMREGLDVYSIVCDGRVSAAADMMRDKHVGSIVVVDESDGVLGIITDRDIALGLALGAATADSFVSELMSRDVETVCETKSLYDVTQIFRDSCVKRLPVVDKEQRLVGIVSIDDVMALLAREMFDTCNALEPKLGHIV